MNFYKRGAKKIMPARIQTSVLHRTESWTNMVSAGPEQHLVPSRSRGLTGECKGIFRILVSRICVLSACVSPAGTLRHAGRYLSSSQRCLLTRSRRRKHPSDESILIRATDITFLLMRPPLPIGSLAPPPGCRLAPFSELRSVIYDFSIAELLGPLRNTKVEKTKWAIPQL